MMVPLKPKRMDWAWKRVEASRSTTCYLCWPGSIDYTTGKIPTRVPSRGTVFSWNRLWFCGSVLKHRYFTKAKLMAHNLTARFPGVADNSQGPKPPLFPSASKLTRQV